MLLPRIIKKGSGYFGVKLKWLKKY
jgi:hypothetical protein